MIRMAKKAVRRIMMLPLMPEELITPELVQQILTSWADDPKKLPREIKAFQTYFLNTYVGKPRVRAGPVMSPRFPPALWNVSAMASRTNNAAESVHSVLNPGVSGNLSVCRFLHLIETEMDRTNERVTAGCKPETKAVEHVKNRLLAVELDKFVNGDRGIMCFLDNCGSIIRLDSVKASQQFVPQTIHGVEDII